MRDDRALHRRIAQQQIASSRASQEVVSIFLRTTHRSSVGSLEETYLSKGLKGSELSLVTRNWHRMVLRQPKGHHDRPRAAIT
jgi:hypothetical protein